jgi:hypothetical protein
MNAGHDVVLLADKGSYFPYENNKRLSDTPLGVKYGVLLPGNRLCALNVKIEGADTSPQLTDEIIAAATEERKYIYVKFTDCSVSLYTMNGTMGMSATAKGVEILGTAKEGK